MNEVKGIKKTLMWGTYKMYGTPTSIASTTLNCDFDELFELISNRLEQYKKRADSGHNPQQA
jgi:hypothetical protein